MNEAFDLLETNAYCFTGLVMGTTFERWRGSFLPVSDTVVLNLTNTEKM